MNKVCKTCKIEKPINNFYRNKNCKGGHLTECKECNKIYKQRNAKHNAELAMARRRRSGVKPKKIFKNEEERRVAHLEACKRWQIKNKEQVDEYNKQYRKENRELCNDRVKNWREHNPHKIAEYNERRTQYTKEFKPVWANDDKIKEFYVKRDKMTKETGIQYQVDHVVPLLGENVCGLHVEYNLQILTAEENNCKGNTFND